MKRGTAQWAMRRQARVTKVVWGLLFLVMGVLFTLHDLGTIDMRAGTARESTSREFDPSHVVDGDTGTRWSSQFSDPQWITVDLGSPAEIRRVKLNWEGAHAKDYQIQVSDDGARWTTAQEVNDSDGGIDDLQVSATGRYLRVYGGKRATPYGYSLYELEVYGPSETLLSQGKTVMASSREGRVDWGPWPLYWPLLMVASGLPLILAPRDDSNQVIGVVLVGLGTFWQLKKLELVSWSFQETSSLVLILIGVLILAQALRSTDEEAKPGGDAGPAETLR